MCSPRATPLPGVSPVSSFQQHCGVGALEENLQKRKGLGGMLGACLSSQSQGRWSWVLSSNPSDARDLGLSAVQSCVCVCVFSLHQHFPRRTCGEQYEAVTIADTCLLPWAVSCSTAREIFIISDPHSSATPQRFIKCLLCARHHRMGCGHRNK